MSLKPIGTRFRKMYYTQAIQGPPIYVLTYEVTEHVMSPGGSGPGVLVERLRPLGQVTFVVETYVNHPILGVIPEASKSLIEYMADDWNYDSFLKLFGTRGSR